MQYSPFYLSSLTQSHFSEVQASYCMPEEPATFFFIDDQHSSETSHDSLFIYSLAGRWLQLGLITKKSSTAICKTVSPCGQMSLFFVEEMSVSCDQCRLNFLRARNIVFQSNNTIVQFHQRNMRVLGPPTPPASAAGVISLSPGEMF